MDAFHDRLARVALIRAAAYGFCLAGGYAVQAHGLLERPSEDIDLFTTIDAEAQFPEAVTAVVQAYTDDGLTVSTLVDTPGFARLSVTDRSVAHLTNRERVGQRTRRVRAEVRSRSTTSATAPPDRATPVRPARAPDAEIGLRAERDDGQGGRPTRAWTPP